ncbi:lysophospholipid acyltransferase family protein [Motilibacter aurantiacus]|uniref:lysophospholipid acyltransferase family protein n=1 Tax=Motilibacter aurantiacus TaxID=2714955 RepID=UPI00140DE680|nr:lysophospholipid acyltransferase family protein [Motilibacter aurantiacus]NHC44189.1 acyltransferase family protein [Motilibacter aurantiacus]
MAEQSAGPLPPWLARGLALVRSRMAGDPAVDAFGFDRELTETVLAAPLRPLVDHWFRVESRGLAHVPADGGALVAANHSGTLPIDALVTQAVLMDRHPAHRPLRLLAGDLVFTLPLIGEIARRSGATMARRENAERLLTSGELVGVFPEGYKGLGKPYAERYRLRRFGRGGFVRAALRTGTPIVPCAIVGAEEIYPMVADAAPLARLLGLPYFPVTPTFPWLGPLGLVPLPSKWLIEFLPPLRTAGYGPGAADDRALVLELTARVRESIAQKLGQLLEERGPAFG